MTLDNCLSVLCYNQGCSNKDKHFNPAENHDKACLYHTGAPVFHEGLKGWTCCKKRVTCFDEWLDMPGCTTGPHNPNKPEKALEVAKSARERAAAESAEEAASRNVLKTTDESDGGKGEKKGSLKKEPEVDKYIKAPPTAEQLKQLTELRGDVDDPKKNLKIQVLGSHKREFDKAFKNLEMTRQNAKIKAQQEAEDALNGNDQTELKIPEGTVCCRKGCNETYPSMTDCIYHPGVEVFHEGCKYWSCCQRVTSDFNSFLNQEGCTRTDDHLWIGAQKQKLKLRWDFFQVGDKVTLNFYGKGAVIDSVICQINSVSIFVEAKIEAGGGKFTFSSELFDSLDVEHVSNKVKVGGTKIEVTLRKKNLINWGDFCPAGKRVELRLRGSKHSHIIVTKIQVKNNF